MLLERSKNAVAKKCFITLDCRTDIKSLALLGDTKAYKAESAKWTGHETRIENGPKVSPFDSFTPWKAAGCCELGVSENSVPLNPMVLLIIIPIKWLFHWEYTLFSDKPISIFFVARLQSQGLRSPAAPASTLWRVSLPLLELLAPWGRLQTGHRPAITVHQK